MSATDELRRMLDERGVAHKDHYFSTTWRGRDGMSYLAGEPMADGILVVDRLTPEQVIAATLGRPKAKSHPYGYERDTGAYDCTRCECGCINDISATYCNNCGGKIEIDENAEKEYYDGYGKHTVFAKKHDDGSLEFCECRYVPATLGGGTLTAEHVREAIFGNSSYASYDGARYYADGIGMQAVADELNTRAERTCHNVAPNPGCFECSVCGCDVSGGDELGANMFNGGWNYCPNCGAKVVSE